MEQCSKCGCADDLSRHHIFPQCFGKHLTSPYLIDQVEKVDLLCRDCHNKYEKIAELLKRDLRLFFGIHNRYQKYTYDRELKLVRDNAVNFCKKKIEDAHKEASRRFFMNMLGLQAHEISKKLIKKFCDIVYRYENEDYFPFGKYIMERVNVQHFIDFWHNDYSMWLMD